jgi:hypothetical protein
VSVKVRGRRGTYRYLTVCLLILLVSSILAVTSFGGQFEDAVAAYERGDFVTAYQLLEPLAEQGNDEAQYNLGGMYAEGRGVQQNYGKAVKWFRKAAEQGNAMAQYNLGGMYYIGKGVPRDFVLAHMWFNLSISRVPTSEGEKREATEIIIDLVASKMTPAQITEAQRLAREWKPKKERK